MTTRKLPSTPASWGTALFLAVLGSIALIGSRNSVSPMDFYQFWFVTRTNLHDVERPYSEASQQTLSAAAANRLMDPATGPLERRTLTRMDEVFSRLADGRMIQSTGTPMLYALAAVISTDSFELSGRVAHAVIVMSYVVSLMLLGRMFRLTALHVVGGWMLLWGFFLPASFDVYFGNVAGVQLAMLVSCAWLYSREQLFAAGLVAAIAALFKPTAAYPVIAATIYIACANNWKATASFIAGGLSGGVVALGLTTWAFGTPAVWVDWFTLMLPQVAETSYALMNGNCGVNSLFVEWTGERQTLALTLVTFVPVLIVAGLRGYRDGRKGNTDRVDSISRDGVIWTISAAVAAMLLCAPLTWQHYYVLLIPGVIGLAVHPVFRLRLYALATFVCLSRLSFSGLGGTGFNGAVVTAILYSVGAGAVFVGSITVLNAGLRWPRLFALPQRVPRQVSNSISG